VMRTGGWRRGEFGPDGAARETARYGAVPTIDSGVEHRRAAGSMRSARTTRATTWSSRMVERRLATTPPGAFYPYNDDGAI